MLVGVCVCVCAWHVCSILLWHLNHFAQVATGMGQQQQQGHLSASQSAGREGSVHTYTPTHIAYCIVRCYTFLYCAILHIYTYQLQHLLMFMAKEKTFWWMVCWSCLMCSIHIFTSIVKKLREMLFNVHSTNFLTLLYKPGMCLILCF